jgi:hypothetical protein
VKGIGDAMSSSTVVVYHYFEKDLTYKNNLVYFLSVAILEEVDYFIMISGECTVALPDRRNVTYIKMDNWNNDFGGYIKFFQVVPVQQYEFFIFINSSVRGPFLPSYSDFRWVNAFIDRLRGDVHLVGASINILPESATHTRRFSAVYGYQPPYVHAQTTAYALSSTAVRYLLDVGFYSVDRTLTKKEVIVQYELKLSQEIIHNGWNIGSFLPGYEGLDYRKLSMDFPNVSSRNGDVLFEGAFYGRTLSPTEAMFVKVNRNMLNEIELASHTFTSLLIHSDKIQKFEPGLALLSSSFHAIPERRKRFKWFKS